MKDTPRKPATPAKPTRDVDLVLSDQIALNLAQPRKLPPQDPPQ